MMALSFPVLAEREVTPIADDGKGRILAHKANAGGFYTVLPSVNSEHLAELLRLYRASLEQREEEITRYLDENQMGTADVLITVIMPGGLIYAAARKADLEEARSELTEITANMSELSRDLMLIQAQTSQLVMLGKGDEQTSR
jgi:hypothetical protein